MFFIGKGLVMAEENNRDFKGVWISKEVWLDDRLSALDKVILTEIDSLDGENGCYASNDYIADFCQCSATKVSKAISKLIEYGYVYVQSFDGRKRVLKSRLTKNASQPCKKDKAEMQNVQDNNINNNKDNNINIKKERKKKSEYDVIIDEMVDDEEIKELLYEQIKMRKMKKKPVTDKALRMLINKLYSLSSDIEEQKKIIEQSIINCWDSFYQLKKEVKNNGNAKRYTASIDYDQFIDN